MHGEGHNHCFMHFLASKHCLRRFFPSLMKEGDGTRHEGDFLASWFFPAQRDAAAVQRAQRAEVSASVTRYARRPTRSTQFGSAGPPQSPSRSAALRGRTTRVRGGRSSRGAATKQSSRVRSLLHLVHKIPTGSAPGYCSAFFLAYHLRVFNTMLSSKRFRHLIYCYARVFDTIQRHIMVFDTSYMVI